MSPASESEFRGNPVIVLNSGPEDRFPFQFGLRKAKLMLEHIQDIKNFVDKYSSK